MRTTLLSMALLAAASTAFAQDAEMKTGVVATDPTWGSTDIPLKFSAQYSCSQTLYTGAEMDAATGSLDTYTVKQLYFPFYGSLSTDIPMDLKVYMTKTSETTLGAAMSMEDFTLVFRGDLMVTPADSGVTVDLTTPFVMKQGEGVVIALNCDQPEWSLIKFENAAINNRVWYAYSADAPCDFTGMSKGSGLPGLTIGYYEGEWSGEVIPETVDLKAVSISGPAKVGLGSLVSVSVTVENLGTAVASGYKVNILDAATKAVVATIENGDGINAGLVKTLTTDLELNETGTYSYLAEVVCEGDTDDTNNVTADTYTVEVVDKGFLPDPMSMNVPSTAGTVDVSWFDPNVNCSGSQSIYPATYFGDLTCDVQLQKVGFNILAQGYPYAERPVKIYMASTDRTSGYSSEVSGYPGDLSELIPEEDFTLVYDGYFSAPAGASGTDTFVDLELDAPFVLEKGKGLAINVICNSEDGNPMVYFRCAKDPDAYWQTYFKSSVHYEDFYEAVAATGTKTRPNTNLVQLALTYALVPAEAAVDLAVESLTVPEAVTLNEAATFKVAVKNVGTVEVEGMTVELLDMSVDEPVVLVSNEVQRMLAAEGSTNVNVKYTFTEAGEYMIAARVVADDDVDADNDMSEPVKVVIEGSGDKYAIDLELVGVEVPESVGLGDTVTFPVTVLNNGTESIPDLTVYMFEGDAESVTQVGFGFSMSALAPGEERVVNVKVAMPDTECDYMLTVRAQAQGDENPDNNIETFTVKVSDDTAVDSVAGDAAFSFADGMLLIGEGVTGVSVADMSGRVILSRDVKAGESVQLNAASGVYVVTLYTADGVKVCKLKM